MRYGLIGSIILHVVVLGLVIFNFTGSKTEPALTPLPPAVSVEIMNPKDFSERQAGKESAASEKPTPPAEIKAPEAPAIAKKEVVEPKPVEKAAPKEALLPPPPKQEAAPAKQEPAPKPEPPKIEKAEIVPVKVPEKPVPKPAPKKQVERKPAPKPKIEEAKAVEQPTPPPKKQEAAAKDDFDPDQVLSRLEKDEPKDRRNSQSMMDTPPSKNTSERQTALINRDPNAGNVGGEYDRSKPWRPASSLEEQARGMAGATGASNSSTDAEILLSQISRQWDLPYGSQGAESMTIKVHFRLLPDGRLDGPPEVLNPSYDPAFAAAADAAKRAIFRAQPFRFPPNRYEQFRDNVISFDPSEMYGAGRG